MPNTFVENAASKNSLLDRLRDAAAAAHDIDGLEMVPMTALDSHTALQVHSEGSSQERLLQIMHCNCVPAQERLHITLANKIGQMFARPGMNDHWPRHDH